MKSSSTVTKRLNRSNNLTLQLLGQPLILTVNTAVTLITHSTLFSGGGAGGTPFDAPPDAQKADWALLISLAPSKRYVRSNAPLNTKPLCPTFSAIQLHRI